jgi:hypothetical protein
MYAIQLLNQSTLISQAKLAPICQALQIQVSRDFAPSYHIDAQLTLTNTDSGATPIYIVDDVPDAPAGALAWHSMDDRGRPYSIIPMKTVLDAGEDPAPTISHELLEMLADPYCNGVRLTNYPPYSRQRAYVAFENCDPVENNSYKINGVSVSNFVFPNWWIVGSRGPWDFLKMLSGPLQMTRGGYLQYSIRGRWYSVMDRHVKSRKQIPHHFSRLARRARHHASLRD